MNANDDHVLDYCLSNSYESPSGRLYLCVSNPNNCTGISLIGLLDELITDEPAYLALQGYEAITNPYFRPLPYPDLSRLCTSLPQDHANPLALRWAQATCALSIIDDPLEPGRIFADCALIGFLLRSSSIKADQMTEQAYSVAGMRSWYVFSKASTNAL